MGALVQLYTAEFPSMYHGIPTHPYGVEVYRTVSEEGETLDRG